jgi:hypothetical protein
MSAGWVAGSVRARAMSRRRIGSAAVLDLARCRDLGEATAALAATSYGHDVQAGQDLDAAQRAVVASVLWNLRVLAGWQPLRGVAILRLLLGAVEASNVVAHVQHLHGGPSRPPYRLGALAVAWPRVSEAATAEEVRQVLTSSVWGDPGGTSPRDIALAMRTDLADRMIGGVPAASSWAAGDTALLLAREVVLQGRPLPARARTSAGRVLGQAALGARTLAELRASLPLDARWALADLDDPAELWRAEGRWWRRLGDDGAAMIRSARPGEETLLGAVALLVADGWQVRAALEVAARGGAGIEVLDEVG